MIAIRRDVRALVVVGVTAAAVCSAIALTQSGSSDDVLRGGAVAVADSAPPSSTVADSAPAQTTTAPASPAADTETDGLQDIDDSTATATETCTMKVLSVRQGDSNDSVMCVQEALATAGFYNGVPTGTFDQATYDAVRAMQQERNLYVDGVVGRETALSIGVWPDEESLVVRTPPPPAGAVDLLGYPLSSVATSGPDAPPLPENSGSGRRLVYDRAGQRIWAVDGDERVIRSWLVSGSQYSNELPGTHAVYSRSEMSTAWNGRAYLPMMVRWLKTERGHIGFHAIPLHVEDRSPYQTEAELGTRLSGGCQRQANADAKFVWDFAQIGTKVVVI